MHVTDIESLSVDTSATFSLDNVSEMNMPDFYVFCPPEHSNERGYRNYGQFSSTTSIKQRQKDFDCVKKYIMTTIQTSPYKILVFKQALKVFGTDFSLSLFFCFHFRNVVVVGTILFSRIYV
jgi:hypothetical protein